MAMITITFPDNTKREYDAGITAKEVAESIGKRLASDALACQIDDKLADLNAKITKNAKLKIITFDSKEGKEIYWHSSSHILAMAVTELFKAKPTIGPSIDFGFYYDFDSAPFTQEDIQKIEKKTEEIIKKDVPFERQEISKAEAKKLFKDNPYKIELINDVAEDKVSIYKNEEFFDLCRGPHVPSTGKIKAFKIMKFAGAYWRGDSKNKMLQRIYGVSFNDKKELDNYLKLLEEAEKRDHRKIGKELNLFSFHEEAPGMPFFHAKGMIVWNELMKVWREEHDKAGYVEIKTPIILNQKLWVQSGHWDHYKDNMYFTKIDEGDYAVKPMNCPGGMLIYKNDIHSYKEFPLRVAEVGLVHRHELSGVLSGLFRVRCFHQDDAHIFATPELLEQEIKNIILLVDHFYKDLFGFDYHVELSTMPAKAMGDPKIWKIAEDTLEKVLKSLNVKYKINPGDGAFYGPKIDFHIKDALGRTWQCATCQLDFQMPERFDLTYDGKDGQKHRPIMLHRTIYGSLERFIGVLTEHFAGKFPLWLAPVQIAIMTITDKQDQYAEELASKMKKFGLRVHLDLRAESISKKVRDNQMQKIPIMITIGEKEAENKTLAIRTLDNKVKFGVDADEFIKKTKETIEKRSLELNI